MEQQNEQQSSSEMAFKNLPIYEVLVDGKPVKYNNKVFINTETKFRFWDRVKVLLGKPLIVKSQMFLMDDKVVFGVSFDNVPPLFRAKKVRKIADQTKGVHSEN